MERLALILTHNRPDQLRQTWEAIGPQVELVLILDNASDSPVTAAGFRGETCFTVIVPIPDQPPNISRMWNQGIEKLTKLADPGAHIAVLCDDAPPPAGWFDAVTAAMAETGAAVGCSAPQGFEFSGAPRVKTAPDSDLAGRMPGWAWILNPHSSVRADESMLLWWADTSVDWEARAAGGMVMIGSHPVPNLLPNGFMATRPDLVHQTGQDGLAFQARWGPLPW
jgi:hypothetical protein